VHVGWTDAQGSRPTRRQISLYSCGRIPLTDGRSRCEPLEQRAEAEQVVDVEERSAFGQQDKRVERRFARPGGRQGAQGILVIQVIDPQIAPDVLDDDELECPSVQRMKGVNDLDFPSRTFAPLRIPQLDPTRWRSASSGRSAASALTT
jgi:hypothetical protein